MPLVCFRGGNSGNVGTVLPRYAGSTCRSGSTPTEPARCSPKPVLGVPPGGTGPAIALQTSQTPPANHPRLHFDLHVTGEDEQEAEAERLISLGASRADWDSYPDDPDFIVLADPDGNRFCIVDLAHEHV